ncbi:hypothetical protein ACSX1A_09015 [Pontibacter sp. MBLB2868]|uniref:hypothetical protein n=1 Tax=Pontibacter sp. MBLB2868 TaxID=3451555 RepID=UPI003F74E849
MSLKDTFRKVKEEVKKEVKVLKGEETKNKIHSQEHEYPNEATAIKEYEKSKQKLFDINLWSHLEGINSTFELYDQRGRKTDAIKPEVGYFIKIILPGSGIENWVQLTDIHVEENLAEFTVHPSEKPDERNDGEKVIKHFFIKEASSTFRVERRGKKLIGYEIGLNEGINNQGEEAGDRALLNTLTAEGGWAGVQALQWNKLVYYFVHPEEARWLDNK